MSTWSIVLAAGSGRRYDPVVLKQYEKIGPWRVVDLSMEVARRELHGATAASEIEENVERTMAEAMLMLCEAP